MSHLESLPGLKLFPQSIVTEGLTEFGLSKTDAGARLAILAAPEFFAINGFEGDYSEHDGRTLLLGQTHARNAAALRTQLPWLQPRRLGLATSVGMGDRLGLATLGHVQAARAVGNIAPIFAQQSIREMTRTGRTPQQVMDDATWGIFQEGWRDGVGADADHQKTPADIDTCRAAGFTFFTVDPGEYVDNTAETASLSNLRTAADRLPPELHPHTSGLMDRMFDIEDTR